MYVIIVNTFDGNSFNLFTNKDAAIAEFKQLADDPYPISVYLVKPDNLEKEFGFGSMGDIYGAEIIMQRTEEEIEF